jgi:hypothetical protein
MKVREWKGDWALVTGASSGIGKIFAEQLAGAGLNVALVARRRERLEALAGALEKAHGARTLVVAMDLAEDGAPQRLKRELTRAGVRIRVLVNNAGFGQWGRFEKTAAETYDRMIRLNIAVLPAMCLLFRDDLGSHSGSAVINVSSLAALQPVPYMAVYAATKAFVQSFSLALYEEWREQGIYVQTLVPGPTATEFDEVAGAYASKLGEKRASPSDVVDKALRALEAEAPLAAAAKGVLKQRVLSALIPPKLFLREAGKMFRPSGD